MNTNYKEEMEIDMVDLIWYVLSKIGIIIVIGILFLALGVGFKVSRNYMSNHAEPAYTDVDSAIESISANLSDADFKRVELTKSYHDDFEQKKDKMSTEVYMNSLKNLNDYIFNFDDDQLELYNLLLDQENGITEIEKNEDEGMEIPLTRGIAKYGVEGGICGVFLGCVVIALSYFLNGTIKIGEEFTDCFGLFLLGDYGEITEGKGLLEQICRKQKWTLNEKRQLTVANIKVLCDKAGTDSIFMTTSLHMDEKEKDEVKKIEKSLTEKGIEVSVGENILHDAGTLARLADYENIVLIEKTCESRYEDMAKIMNMINKQKLNVIGIVAL